MPNGSGQRFNSLAISSKSDKGESEDDNDTVLDDDRDDEIDDPIIMDESPSSSSSSSFLQQLVAQRTAFVQVKQEELTDDHATPDNINSDYHDPDGHLCVVCMDQERSCLYVPCNHLAVCAEYDAEIMAASLPCPMCNTAIDREGSVVGLMVA